MHTLRRSAFNVQRSAYSLSLAVLLLSLPTACSGDNTATAPASTPTAAPAASAAPAAVAATLPGAPTPMAFDSTNITIKGKAVTAEVAESQAQIERGLMYRDHMDDDHGMLFVMEEPRTWSFWMKNTRIPLDIIFLDKTGRVLTIQARRPFDETGRGPDTPALYVIELNLGMAQKIGLQRGDVVEIPKKYLKNIPASPEK